MGEKQERLNEVEYWYAEELFGFSMQTLLLESQARTRRDLGSVWVDTLATY